MKKQTSYTAIMKKIAAAVLIFLGLIQVGRTQVYFDIDTMEAYVGDSISIPIHVSNFTNMGSLTLYIDFSTSALAYGGAQNWNSGFGLITPLIHQSGSRISISWINVFGASLSPGDLVILRFKYKGGNSNLSFASTCEVTNPQGVVQAALYSNGQVKQALTVTNSVSNSPLCQGDSSKVIATPAGGTGSYSYQWSSVPAGFTSSLQQAWVTPSVNTTYTCQVTDGADTATSSVTVEIFSGGAPASPTNMLPADNSQNVSSPVNLSWSAVLNATHYDIWLWHTSGTQPVNPTYSSITQISKSVSNLSFGVEYSWQVRARNACFSALSAIQTFKVRALPDLHVSNITYTQPLSGQPMTVSWTVTNDGAGPTVVPQWMERVWLSPDPEIRIGEQSDKLLGQFPNLTYLPAGGSYTQSRTINIPANINGPHFLWVVLDDLDALFMQWGPGGPQIPYNPPPYVNSWTHGGAMVNVVEEVNERDNWLYVQVIFPAAPTADLKPKSSITPSSAFSGTSVSVQWTVGNDGEVNLNASDTWIDRIFISADTLFDPATDPEVGSAVITGPLEVDSTYTYTKTINIPAFIFGNHYFFLKTDQTDQIFEYVYEGNNMVILDSINVILTPPPDMQVINIITPDTLSNGEVQNILYFAQNLGGSQTNTTQWKDKVYLSQDPSGTLTGAILLGTVSNSLAAPLPAGGSYNKNVNWAIPNGISGHYYVLVQTDAENKVFEHTYENNNITRSDTTIFIQSPDMVVTEVIVPSIDSLNQKVSVKWWVKNMGPGQVFPDWSDYVFVTNNPASTLSGLTKSAALSATVNLLPGDSILRQILVTLPGNNPGPFYFYVLTDATAKLSESIETNNVTRSAQALNLHRPDLQVVQFLTPAQDTSGNSIQISWSIKNNGLAKTTAGAWKDKIYISSAPAYDPNSVTLLAEYTLNKVLNVGDTTWRTRYVPIPHGLSGNYYLYLITDAANNHYEMAGENNNVSTPKPIQITLGPWPDLDVISMSIPDTVNIGFTATMQFSIENNGTDDLVGRVWTDKVFLSTDPSWNPVTAKPWGSGQYGLSVLADSSYDRTMIVNVPTSFASGLYWVYVYTDFNNDIYEYTDEGNNWMRGGPVYLKAYPPVDLAVTSFAGPNSINSGTSLTVSWSVVNQGVAKTLPASWYDAVYLSADSIFGPGDQKLKEIQKNGPILPGAGYSKSQSFTMPNGISGTYYLIIVADYKDDNKDSDRSNNQGLDYDGTSVAQPIQIVLTPPPDLQIANFAAPPQATSGQPFEMIWTVLNAGVGTTPSGWVERFYLSTDFTLDQGDIIIHNHAHQGALSPGQYYIDTFNVVVPVNYAGNWILIMATDISNQVYEYTGEGNNTSTSLIYLEQPPPADLIVSSITTPDSALAGSDVQLSWLIYNQGDYAASGLMKDIVYLSDDPVWDAGDEILAEKIGSVTIAPLANYSRSATVTIPGREVGYYYFIVKTDILNNIYETNDTNNTGVAADSMKITMKALPLHTIVSDTLYDFTNLYYQVIIDDTLLGETMLTTLEADSIFGMNEMYMRYNLLASRTVHDFAHENPYRGDQEILIPSLIDGIYYLLMYGNNTAGASQEIELEASILEFDIVNVTPDEGGNSGIVTLLLKGSKYDTAMTVMLIGANDTIVADSLYFVNISKCYASFDLTGVPLGLYDVMAINSPGDTTILVDGFEVATGEVAKIGLSILAPANVRRGNINAFTVDYENISNVNAVNPVLHIEGFTASPIALDVPGLSANQTVLNIPLTTADGPPGVIPPGYRSRVLVYTRSSHGMTFLLTVPGYY